jgi:hypothetical protein
MKPKTLKALEAAIETGIELGYSRAYKHDMDPSEIYIKSCISDAIWTELYEWFDIEELENDDTR